VLIIIAQYGVDSPGDLCRHLSLDSGSMTRMLDRLEQKNFLVRQRSEADRRQVQLVLTKEGLKLADRLPHIGAEAMNQLAVAITAEELEALESILKKILVAAGDSLTLQRVGNK
jgi:DNA-binding MarR family transcriptional regulator